MITSTGKYTPIDISEVGPADGLVAWYPLQGDTKDYANSNDGTNNGAVATARGYSFDGVDDYIRINGNLTENISGLTTSVWFRHSGDGTYQAALHKATSTAIGTSEYWSGVQQSSNFLTATIGANDGVGWAAGQTDIVAQQNTWYHLVAAWNGSNVSVYVDGVFNKSYSLSVLTNLTTPTRFGASGDSTGYLFTGNISDVRIYNRALSTEEISILYEITNPEINNRMKQSKDCVYIRGEFQEA